MKDVATSQTQGALVRRAHGRRSGPAAVVAGLFGLAALAAACGGGRTAGGFSATPTTTRGATLSVESSPVGPILATGNGHTLYEFALDTPHHSACTSSICVALWPPLLKNSPTLAHDLKRSLVGTIRRPDGASQVTYGGHPLYTWSGDTKPGMVTGQALNNAGGPWFVISPSGARITTAFSVTG